MKDEGESTGADDEMVVVGYRDSASSGGDVITWWVTDYYNVGVRHGGGGGNTSGSSSDSNSDTTSDADDQMTVEAKLERYASYCAMRHGWNLSATDGCTNASGDWTKGTDRIDDTTAFMLTQRLRFLSGRPNADWHLLCDNDGNVVTPDNSTVAMWWTTCQGDYVFAYDTGQLWSSSTGESPWAFVVYTDIDCNYETYDMLWFLNNCGL